MAGLNDGQGVSVPAQAVINQLHERYGKTIAQIMQENAELMAAIDGMQRELEEYRSKALAQRQAVPGRMPTDPLAGRAVFRQEGQPDQVVGLVDVTESITGEG